MSATKTYMVPIDRENVNNALRRLLVGLDDGEDYFIVGVPETLDQLKTFAGEIDGFYKYRGAWLVESAIPKTVGLVFVTNDRKYMEDVDQ